MTKKTIVASLLTVVTLMTVTGCSDRDERLMGIYNCKDNFSKDPNKFQLYADGNFKSSRMGKGTWTSSDLQITLLSSSGEQATLEWMTIDGSDTWRFAAPRYGSFVCSKTN